MRSAPAGIAVAVLLGLLIALGISTVAVGAPTPSPTPNSGTGSTSVTVTIPGSGSGGGGGGAGGGGSGGGGSTPTPTPSAGPPPKIPPHPVVTAISLTLNHRVFRPGDLMVATGHGFRPGERVRFVIYSSPMIVGDFAADKKGTVKARIRLSTRIGSGRHTVEAFGWKSDRIASAPFAIDARAGIGVPNPPWIVWVIGVLAVLGAAIAIAVLGFGKIAGLAGLTGAKV